MSIVSMQKMSLVAHNSERNKLLRLFISLGCVEMIDTKEIAPSEIVIDKNNRQDMESKLLRISFALTFLREMSKEMLKINKDEKVAVNLKKENRLIPLEEYENAAKDEMETFSIISEMEKINGKLVDIKTDRARLSALREQLTVYSPLEIPFSDIRDTEHTFMLVGIVPISRVEELKEKSVNAVIESYSGEKYACIAVVGHKEYLEETKTLLANYEFNRCSFSFDMTADTKIKEIDTEIDALQRQKEDLIREGASYTKYISLFKVTYDYYNIELAKISVVENCGRTQKAIVMEGWTPKEKADELRTAIESKCKRVEVFFSDPSDDEIPPTLTKNVGVVSAFDGITDMFGRPSYREQDPNLFVALFYFLFFGIMISDAGYGLLMAIACFAFVKITKPVKNSGKMMIMFGFCGISTVIWGALFGGWFGVETAKLPQFLKAITWFSPLDEPLKMFMLALGMGVLQIGTGFALNGVAEIKKGNILKGILSNFSWDIIFIGLLLISPNLMLFLGAIQESKAWFAISSQIGMYVAIVGFVLLLLGGAVGKKNPVKMVGGALGSAYGAINVVSDLLSYSRLFGLGLTTGVIGYVINMLADIIVNTFLGGLWVGWIIAVPVLLIGHTFNFAINLLGAYVHNSRLQYIEFFGKFYEGSGRAYAPLGSKTKYTYIDN